MSNTYKVVGAYEFEYVKTTCNGYNGSFEYGKEQIIGYKICLMKGDKNFTLSLTEEEGECMSGWCTASWGLVDLIEEDTRDLITLIPKEVNTLKYNEENIDNKLMFFSSDGGDGYYPNGRAYIKKGGWIDTNRSSRTTEI